MRILEYRCSSFCNTLFNTPPHYFVLSRKNRSLENNCDCIRTNGLRENKYSVILRLVEETRVMTTRPRCKTGTGKPDVENCRKSDRTIAVRYYKGTADWELHARGVIGATRSKCQRQSREQETSYISLKEMLVSLSSGAHPPSSRELINCHSIRLCILLKLHYKRKNKNNSTKEKSI